MRIEAYLIFGGQAEEAMQFYQAVPGGQKEFWGDTFGALTDKFGISWQINIEAPKAS